MTLPADRVAPLINGVRFKAAPLLDRQTGLLGFLRIEIDDLIEIDGVALRRTAHGELRLSFPERADANGRRHPIVRPTRAAAWRSMEAQVLAELRKQGVLQ